MRKGLYYSIISIFLFQNNPIVAADLNGSDNENVLELQISEDIDGLHTIIPVFEKGRAIKISKPYFKIYPGYTEHLIGRAMVYFPVIEEVLSKYDLPDDLKYIPFFESGLRPDIISSAGAVGLWQLMKYTAMNYGLTVNGELDERMDFEKATDAAAQYLKSLYDEFQDWSLALMAYNAGPYRVKKVLRTVDRSNMDEIIRRMPSETRTYLSKIIAAKLIFTAYDSYKIVPEMPSPSEIHLKTIQLEKGFSLTSLAKEYKVSTNELASLNPHIKQNSVYNSKNSLVNIRIPYSQNNENRFLKTEHYFKDVDELKKVANTLNLNYRYILMSNGYFTKSVFRAGLLTLQIPRNQYMEIMQIIGPSALPNLQKPLLTIDHNPIYLNNKIESKRVNENVEDDTFRYFLQPRETLIDVATKFNITIETLLKLNPSITNTIIQSVVVPRQVNTMVHL
ncbi:transglycosylase SLT domain-containing protein [Membranihabitans marinus]|uniref:transglycosylase SLT domain-containing protein n=1 Tax=Membranihabitans marinus TaxID=1227546 RepID=UPI001F432215|nr:transglycosylase SLT domain-containing protein [Membranihabitans marinus]